MNIVSKSIYEAPLSQSDLDTGEGHQEQLR